MKKKEKVKEKEIIKEYEKVKIGKSLNRINKLKEEKVKEKYLVNYCF